ncbi:MBL fold metallo-hydrolase [Metabacillus sp. HB246100]
MKHSITFYGGVNTIGGVHILLSNGKKGLLFDLGVTWAWGLFGGAVLPDSERALQHYLLTRLAPPVPSIYKEELVKEIPQAVLKDLWKIDEIPQLETIDVFVSHIHQDHMALLPFVKEDTKVYMHKDAHAVYKGVAQSGEYPYTDAQVIPLEDLETVSIDEDFSFKMIEVDHDTPGASGLIIKVGNQRIAFTGDWRKHGRHANRIDEFIKHCQKEKVEILLTEGTTLRKETSFVEPIVRNERDVAEEFGRVAESAKGLLYVNILARNVERVADFMMKTKELGRKLVMDERTATLWFTATREGISYLPEDHPSREIEMEVIRLLNGTNRIVDLPYQTTHIKEIYSNKEEYVMYLIEERTPLMAELETLGNTAEKSIYFHADGNPLTNKNQILQNWFQLYSIHYHYYATGGHATPEAITSMIEEIKPKVVVPLHSLHPSVVNSKGITKYCPSYGETISLESFVNKDKVSLV